MDITPNQMWQYIKNHNGDSPEQVGKALGITENQARMLRILHFTGAKDSFTQAADSIIESSPQGA